MKEKRWNKKMNRMELRMDNYDKRIKSLEEKRDALHDKLHKLFYNNNGYYRGMSK